MINLAGIAGQTGIERCPHSDKMMISMSWELISHGRQDARVINLGARVINLGEGFL